MTRRRPLDEPLARGTVTFQQHGVRVELEVAHGVFSATTIDPGTRLLLRWLGGRDDLAGRTVLDLGCGYGPLAVWLAAAGAGHVEAVDRDAVAVEWTARNAGRNGVGDVVAARASLGYDDVEDGPYGLIVSNIPAKVGRAALEHLLLDAAAHLRPDGEVAIVVVAGLADEVRSILTTGAVETVAEHANRGYLQLTYRFTAPGTGDPAPGFARGVYGRAVATFAAGGLSWEAETARTLPEFDTLGHGTAAAVDLLGAAPPDGPATVIGTGQGHLALALAAAGVDRLRLVDRDLLALRVSACNLARLPVPPSVTLHHAARPTLGDDPTTSTIAVVALAEKEPVAVTAALLGPPLAELAPGATAVVHGRAADVTRVVELLPRHGPAWLEAARARRGGHAAVRLRRR